MADTDTVFYDFVKPEVGASTDTWGPKLNTNMDWIEQEIARARIPHSSPASGPTTNLAIGQTAGHRVFLLAPSEITTISITGESTALFLLPLYVRITNGGLFPPIWPAEVVWAGTGATPPVLSSSGHDWIELFTVDSGAIWHAHVIHSAAGDPALNPRASVYRSAVQGETTEAGIGFDSERYDVGSMHDNSVNNTRLVVPAGQGGLYAINFFGAVSDTGASAGSARVRFRKGGSTILRDSGVISIPASSGISLPLYTHEVLAAADYVEAMVTIVGADMQMAGGLTGVTFELVRVR